MKTLQKNQILDADSYKASHQFVYPKSITGMFSYLEARSKGDTIVPFGMQMFIQKYLMNPVTTEMVDDAEAFMKAHGEPFDRGVWDYLVEEYAGYFPVNIMSVPEGTPVPSQNVIATIECVDPKLFWLSSYLETALQRGVWYPTTIASSDYAIKKNIKSYFERSGADLAGLPFMLHDFGGRGVSSEESAQIGGAAHLVNFMGSDTISGIRAANFFYFSPMSAFSVPASEHTIQTSFGASEEEQTEYLRTMIKTFGKPGAILSIVIDGYDTFREANILCTTLKQDIIDSGAKVVFRPDSGDPMEIVPKLLKMQRDAFGYTLNSAGFMKINNVGIIQGDGVDALLIDQLLLKITNQHYAADNIVFGSGGSLLQKVNRDTFSFAQKASAIRVDGNWIPIKKQPITDSGKNSKAGRLMLQQNICTKEFRTVDMSTEDYMNPYWENALVCVYSNGFVRNVTTLDNIRERAAV